MPRAKDRVYKGTQKRKRKTERKQELVWAVRDRENYKRARPRIKITSRKYDFLFSPAFAGLFIFARKLKFNLKFS